MISHIIILINPSSILFFFSYYIYTFVEKDTFFIKRNAGKNYCRLIHINVYLLQIYFKFNACVL